MERKTKVSAEAGRQEIVITREFDLPVDLLFKAYTEPEIVEQWMGNKVLKLDNHKYGGWHFRTTDAAGNILFQAHGTIHAFEPNQQIVRTFQMDNAAFDVTLEFLDFKKLTDTSSLFSMHIIYRSVELRDLQLKMPFEFGLNMAHGRLQEIMNQHKTDGSR
ncbi:SRPBCC domain-containing protein [Emticicia sp. TH156]|uniref:SRPBCC domain-containing protein n=1 Tax=Emticicia sp. TH156 TaxID=2067454 RepID=UPI000C758839|nr:SRPBCC domain-containing protein [Emticicia sp. TH156]PLK44724.1 ATPase [Emticicia sp. TH156]